MRRDATNNQLDGVRDRSQYHASEDSEVLMNPLAPFGPDSSADQVSWLTSHLGLASECQADSSADALLGQTRAAKNHGEGLVHNVVPSRTDMGKNKDTPGLATSLAPD